MTGKNNGMLATQDDELILVLDGIYSELEQNIKDAKKSISKDLAAKHSEQLAAIKSLLNELKYSVQQNQAIHTDMSETIKQEFSSKADADAIADKVLAGMPAQEEVDYDKISESVTAIAAEQSKQVLDAVAAIPVAENVDYSRIVGETAEKVIESLPPVEKIDYEKLADMVAERVAAPAIDYDLLAEKVAEKISGKEASTEVFIDEDGVQSIADTVVNKISDGIKVEAIDYDRVCQAAQAAQIVPDPVDYDRIVDVLLDRLSVETFTFEEVEETPVEETPAEEVVEEAVVEEAPVEEPVVEEAPVEETVEEPVVEEAPVEEAPAAQEELAAAEVTVEPAPVAPVIGLVQADGDLVIRLKRSFVAKLKQSEDDIKGYYSSLKNALTEYKRINSNISWHGDRFNFGRDTVARMTIIGKTLGLYLALDPLDPEFKQTVYRQKDVSKQKAYEGTPFMVKIKSDGGLKKAVRLVGILAEKLGAEKETEFEAVDYVAMYPTATDEEMLAEGLIKATKEKKVDLDF